MSLVEMWKEIVRKANEAGIPLPMARDPGIGRGSVTYTLVVVSGGLCTVTILMMLACSVSKLTGAFSLNENTMDLMKESFSCSIQFLIASLGAHLGRKMQKNGKDASLDGKAE
jgi:hypothetical protein